MDGPFMIYTKIGNTSTLPSTNALGISNKDNYKWGHMKTCSDTQVKKAVLPNGNSDRHLVLHLELQTVVELL
jgi:hypothetical protein